MIPSTQLKREANAKRWYNSSIWVISCALRNSWGGKIFVEVSLTVLKEFYLRLTCNSPQLASIFPRRTLKQTFLLVFVIHNVHHNNFKLCNSNLEGSICHSAAIHPSKDEAEKLSVIFLTTSIFLSQVLVKSSSAKKAIFSWILKSRKWFLMVLGAPRSLNVWYGRRKFSWINFHTAFMFCKSPSISLHLRFDFTCTLKKLSVGRGGKSIFNAIN